MTLVVGEVLTAEIAKLLRARVTTSESVSVQATNEWSKCFEDPTLKFSIIWSIENGI